MISDEDKITMETLYWWGIPTLFRCKNETDPNNITSMVGASIMFEIICLISVNLNKKGKY